MDLVVFGLCGGSKEVVVCGQEGFANLEEDDMRNKM
jgi:hypothetical protein